MWIKAYAKINLSLDVIGKREDGYHFLRMVMQTIELYDILNIEFIEKGIQIKCDKPYIPCDKRNLVYKAVELFVNKYSVKKGVRVSIIKNIPVAAGLAGGSSDAAAVLKAMKDIYAPKLQYEDLIQLGTQIGADVPYCIIGGTALCEGIGEKVTPISSFKNNILVLVKPSFGVSTAEVYKGLDINKIKIHPNTKALISAVNSGSLFKVSKNMRNVLENVTLKRYPLLRKIKDELIKFGALGALMSGSGPSIFGIFDDMLKAQICYDNMKSKYKEVFITRTV